MVEDFDMAEAKTSGAATGALLDGLMGGLAAHVSTS
jgi:hypothetical protein